MQYGYLPMHKIRLYCRWPESQSKLAISNGSLSRTELSLRIMMLKIMHPGLCQQVLSLVHRNIMMKQTAATNHLKPQPIPQCTMSSQI